MHNLRRLPTANEPIIAHKCDSSSNEILERRNQWTACTGIRTGLINAHTHAPMALLPGLADDLRRDVWQIGYLMPVEREFVRPEFCWLGTQLASAQMIRSGITCFADMYYFEETVADAAAQIGIRAICAQIIQKLPAPDAASYEDGLRLAEDFAMRWQGHDLVVPALGPHAAYASTARMLRELCGDGAGCSQGASQISCGLWRNRLCPQPGSFVDPGGARRVSRDKESHVVGAGR